MDKHDQTACSACLPGLFQSNQTSTHCEACAVGHFSNRSDGNDQCLKCDAGLFQDSRERSECKQCAAGFFAKDKGKNSCTNCDDLGDYFQESSGATLCEHCPLNSQRYVGAGQGSGSNRTSCKCQTKFWRHDGLSGKACLVFETSPGQLVWYAAHKHQCAKTTSNETSRWRQHSWEDMRHEPHSLIRLARGSELGS